MTERSKDAVNTKRIQNAQERAQKCGFRTLESCLDWVEGQVGIYQGNGKAIKPVDKVK